MLIINIWWYLIIIKIIRFTKLDFDIISKEKLSAFFMIWIKHFELTWYFGNCCPFYFTVNSRIRLFHFWFTIIVTRLLFDIDSGTSSCSFACKPVVSLCSKVTNENIILFRTHKSTKSSGVGIHHLSLVKLPNIFSFVGYICSNYPIEYIIVLIWVM